MIVAAWRIWEETGRVEPSAAGVPVGHRAERVPSVTARAAFVIVHRARPAVDSLAMGSLSASKCRRFDMKPYRAEQVGSLLRPPELLAMQAAVGEGRATAEQLRAVEDRAIAEALRKQREIGLDISERRRDAAWLVAHRHGRGGRRVRARFGRARMEGAGRRRRSQHRACGGRQAAQDAEAHRPRDAVPEDARGRSLQDHAAGTLEFPGRQLQARDYRARLSDPGRAPRRCGADRSRRDPNGWSTRA